jgi:hypothetical protein
MSRTKSLLVQVEKSERDEELEMEERKNKPDETFLDKPSWYFLMVPSLLSLPATLN